MSHATLLTGLDRRRRWRPEEKLSILQEAFAPGAIVSEVARRREVSTALIYGWRRQAQEAMSGFVPAQIVDDPVVRTADASGSGCIKVVLPSGAYVEVPFETPPGIIGAVLGSLR